MSIISFYKTFKIDYQSIKYNIMKTLECYFEEIRQVVGFLVEKDFKKIFKKYPQYYLSNKLEQDIEFFIEFSTLRKMNLAILLGQQALSIFQGDEFKREYSEYFLQGGLRTC